MSLDAERKRLRCAYAKLYWESVDRVVLNYRLKPPTTAVDLHTYRSISLIVIADLRETKESEIFEPLMFIPAVLPIHFDQLVKGFHHQIFSNIMQNTLAKTK